MQIGRVIGTVVATHKHGKLHEAKLLLVQPLGLDDTPRGVPLLAIDSVGAGVGEKVLVVKQQIAEIDKQSPDRTKLRVFKEGDSLWVLANAEYVDPGMWRVIANHNRLENPRIIAPGSTLELPPLL
jgi:ethanolamine utilization protein EutN